MAARAGQVSVQDRTNGRKFLYHSGFVMNQRVFCVIALRLRIFESLEMQETGSLSHDVKMTE